MNKRCSKYLFFISAILISCKKDIPMAGGISVSGKNSATPYYIQIPNRFPEHLIPETNLPTVEGIELGRKLFYDPILSRNRNISCSSCHKQENGFSDSNQFSIGTNNERSEFHSMSIVNLAWQPRFFWNGRANSLEKQALAPVVNPLEMDMTWPEVEQRLNTHDLYPNLFFEAFGTDIIDSTLVTRAIAQFEYTIISANSKWDRYLRNEVQLTPLEEKGRQVFTSLEKHNGDCFHCHSDVDPFVGDFVMRNNGIDSDSDLKPGFFSVTGLERDYGKFKTPSLRNLAFTAPYMHDGRFETLREVLDFYSEGVHFNRTVDPLMEFANEGGVDLSEENKDALIAFLLTLTDSSLITNPAFSDPNK